MCVERKSLARKSMNKTLHSNALLALIERYLREGTAIEIDGLGSFELDADNRVVFEPNDRIRVFLAYAEEDRVEVTKLYYALLQAGFEPWMDRGKLLPGQNWPRAIERAIEISDAFVACFSTRSIVKRGQFQSELRYALDCARQLPLDQTFVIPVRLEECAVPRRISNHVHYVDLFPDWQRGLRRIARSIRKAARDRPLAGLAPN
jgi:TIR domain